MKISRIEFENFRNFRDHGEILCSTDGAVTIIYGKNGDGKTTMHQLLQWVFYGQVHFNKTATEQLYNLAFEADRPFGSTFDVMGRVEFAHNGISYSLTRIYRYKKELNNSQKIAEDLTLLMRDENNNWKKVNDPNGVIEQVLPSGLSEYFFFDGESMIADLRLKGQDSAEKLKTALYSMFDLDVLDNAISHIGRTDLKTTVLGKLFLNKGSIASGSEINAIKINIETAQSRIESIKGSISNHQKDKQKLQDEIISISEKIGNTKSKQEYETQRKNLQKSRDLFLENASRSKGSFGDEVSRVFPKLLVSKAIEEAKKVLHLEVEKNDLPSGLDKKLIYYLTREDNKRCICGNLLCDEEKEHILSYLKLLPPNSYTNLYNEFVVKGKEWGADYSLDTLDSYIKAVSDNNDSAASCDKQIKVLDEQEKSSPDIDKLVIARQQAEDQIHTLDKSITDENTELKKLEIYLKQQMQKYTDMTNKTAEGKKAQYRIQLMEKVLSHFEALLSQASLDYSHKLEENIQSLINDMLTSRRTVKVSDQFAVRITDNYDSEAKSEGQFAVVSFAYIGGILRMLKSEDRLSNKEYPLVLDGPFSKLDEDQRLNVVNKIPEFATQVILFSKDDLQHLFPPHTIGKVWTIESNEEKNIAWVKEGFLWK